MANPDPARPARTRWRMQWLFASALAGALALGSGDLAAQTLTETLATTYVNSPALEAARARLRGVDEGVPQARGTWRPSVTLSGGVGATYVDNQDRGTAGALGNGSTTTNPRSATLQVTQPIYRGGRGTAQLLRAEHDVMAERARLLGTEQQILLGAVTAHMDVVRDQALLDLNVSNVRVIERQLEAAQDRFEVGEVTRTDVAQAEARLARARADAIRARGNLDSSRANYLRVTGMEPGTLEAPPQPPDLPGTLEQLLALADTEAFAVIAAAFDERAAQQNVDLIAGEMLPSVNVTGSLTRSEAEQGRDSRRNIAQVTANVTVPIYQQGIVSSRVRAARQIAGERRQILGDTRRSAREAATIAWESLTSAEAQIESFESQVVANEIALEGVEQEAFVGARTVLDVLDAEQELLDARVSLVVVQRDATVAAYQVKSAGGQLTGQRLDLPVPLYDFTQHFEAVRDRLWGTDIPGE